VIFLDTFPKNHQRIHEYPSIGSRVLPHELLHSYVLMIVLLFCRNHFIVVYCHMLIAALEFMLCRSRETVLRTLYGHACPEIRTASGAWLST